MTVTDDNDCTATAAEIVTEPDAINLSTTITHLLCNGDDDGAVDLTVTDDIAPYSYSWSNSATTQDISSLTAGTYFVTVADDNSCTATTNATVTEPDELVLSTLLTNIGCNGSSTGEIDLTVSGGSTPYAYEWSNTATTEDLSSLAAGSYTVTVTDDNACTATTSATVTACSPSVTTLSTGITTWSSQTRTFCDDLIIPDGATLQLQDTRLEFARLNASNQPVNLIIEPGGMLIMQNTTLTNLSGCDEMWQGVIVLANPNAAPDDYNENGAIVSLDGFSSGQSEISNAEFGILTNSTGSGGYYAFQGGGILRLRGVNFINNRIGMLLKGAMFNASFVYECSFTCNDNFLQPDNNGNTLLSHIHMQGGVGYLPVVFSRFDNTTTNPTPIRGVGINAITSRGVLVAGSDFENLNFGIRIQDGSNINYVAYGSEFTNNDFGVFATGTSNIYIAGDETTPNIFNVPDATTLDVAGIHVENSTGLHIAHNLFVGNATSACNGGYCSYGIVTDNTGQAGGRIFRNDFYGTHFGLQTEGRNPQLSIRCNRFEADNHEHENHAWSTLATECVLPYRDCLYFPCPPCGTPICYTICTTGWFGELRDQGTSACDFNHQRAAGNRWMTNDVDDPANINCLGKDKDIFVQPTVPFTYYHHFQDIDQKLKVKPECASAWWWPSFRYDCSTAELGTSCDESTIAFRIAPPDSQQNVQEYIDTMIDRKNEYLNTVEQKQNDMDSIRGLLDNGNTATVLDSVLNMEFGITTKNNILKRNSPLSDDALMAVMLEGVYAGVESQLKDMLRDLLTLNVPLGKKTIQVMQLSDVDLEQERIDSVFYVQATGPYDTLRMAYTESENEWKYYDSELRQIDNGLRFANGYLDALDTTGASNEYEDFLRSDSTLTSKKLLAELLLAKDSLAQAEAVLDTVWMLSEPEDSLETLWFAGYTELMSAIAQDSGIYLMDSTQKAQMYSIAESGAHIAPKAQGVLSLVDTAAFEYPIEKIEYSAPKTSTYDPVRQDTIIIALNKQIQFSLYPNPNDGTMTLEYELEKENGWFVLNDVSGKELVRISLLVGKHKLRIEQPSLQNGIYLFKVLNGKEQLHTSKVVVIK